VQPDVGATRLEQAGHKNLQPAVGIAVQAEMAVEKVEHSASDAHPPPALSSGHYILISFDFAVATAIGALSITVVIISIITTLIVIVIVHALSIRIGETSQ
jgi:hypothetical protein